MKKSKINIDEVLNDVDKVISLVQEIEDNPSEFKDKETKAKKLEKNVNNLLGDFLEKDEENLDSKK